MKKVRKIYDEKIELVAKKENVSADKLAKLLNAGRVVIPYNPRHSPEPCGIGECLKVKVNVNIGTSTSCCNLKEELRKANVAVEYKADTIMDLSTGGNIDLIRDKILKTIKIPVGSVPIYQAAIKNGKLSVLDMDENTIFNTIEKHAKSGVDFMTLHCGITREGINSTKKRLLPIVSRGGAFLAAWIAKHNKENPLYSNYEYLLEMAKKYEFCISLGDALRPGCIADATDNAQINELLTIGKLVEKARKKGVEVIVEGPGHIPMHQIEANVRIEKTICKGAPFYVLGPLVTDVAPGYDHIVAAIGGALAAYYGADFICYVTPSEHLSLPTVEDVKEGLIAARIAAHSADLARSRKDELNWNFEMSKARSLLNWKKMFELAIDAQKAKLYRRRIPPKEKKVCSMCGEVCAIKVVEEHLKGK